MTRIAEMQFASKAQHKHSAHSPHVENHILRCDLRGGGKHGRIDTYIRLKAHAEVSFARLQQGMPSVTKGGP